MRPSALFSGITVSCIHILAEFPMELAGMFAMHCTFQSLSFYRLIYLFYKICVMCHVNYAVWPRVIIGSRRKTEV